MGLLKLERRVLIERSGNFIDRFFRVFLPVAKPTGHRTVRVVVVVDLLLGDYFEVMTSEVDQLPKVKVNFFGCPISILFISHPKFPSRWDPSGSIKTCRSLTRFLFGVGSVGIDQDLSLPDPISLRGGICSFY